VGEPQRFLVLHMRKGLSCLHLPGIGTRSGLGSLPRCGEDVVRTRGGALRRTFVDMMPKKQTTISDDKRAAEYLANERTFLAWIRTSIAVISLGFVVAKFSLWLRELGGRIGASNTPSHTGASLPMGLLMMAFGGVLAILAARRYWVVNHDIDCGRVSADHGLIIMVTCLVAALAVAMIFYLLLT
jgi:putative membrane protein